MKKINISFYLLSGFILFLTSCVGTEDNLFDESAALRINHAVQNAHDLLISAENGWVMQYFPTENQSGVTFLIKFKKDGKAEMATKNEYVTAYTPDSTAWDVVPESGPILTLNSYGKTFHLFSDPASGLGQGLGVGLNGDYEFVVMSHTDDFIQLKGKKRGTDITLNRLPANQDWKGYFSMLDNINSTLFNAVIKCKFNLLIDDKPVYTLDNGISHIFTAVSVNENDDNREFPFIITEKGLRFSKATEIGDKTVRTFELNSDNSQLICVDKDVNAKITAPDPVDFFSTLIDNRKNMTFTNSDATMSASVRNGYKVVEDGITARTRKLDYICFTRNKDWGVSLVIRTSRTGGIAIEGFLSFKMTPQSGTELDLTFNGFTGSFNSNGKAYYDTYAGVSDFVNMLQGSYRLAVQGSVWASNTVRLTSVSDSDKWFDLVVK